jgi:tol-pal system protein YbgF
MKKASLILLILCLLTTWGWAQDRSRQNSKWGIGVNFGLQKPYCDVQHTGVGLAGEAMAKMMLNDRFHLTLSVGYGMLNDGFDYNSFETNLIAADLKANINLLKPGRFNPYLILGLGVHNFEYSRTKPWAIGSPSLEGERYSDAHFLYGGGIEYRLSPKLSLNAFADYRFTTGDALDGAESGDYKDGYLNGRMGVFYYLGKGAKTQEEDEDLLALEPVQLDELEEGEQSDELDLFDQQLDQQEGVVSGDYTMQDYVRLKSRVDELKTRISERESELDQLKSTLQSQNQRIMELESALGQPGAPIGSGTGITTGTTRDYGGGAFSTTYENALRQYYARDYRQAIEYWEQLKSKYPNHRLASNCQYWIGEAYFGMGNYQRAAEAFQNVFNYPVSYKKDDATLMLGRCYIKLNDPARARSYFQGVVDDYPDSEYVEKARQWLIRLQ